jgi:uncharacterized membrane protein
MSENTAALLSYVLGWITGLIFLLIDKRPYVRFHAAQSLVLFGGLHILRAIIGIAFGFGWWLTGIGRWGGWGGGLFLISAISLLSFVLWIVCMVKAHQGVRFRVPFAADIADGLVGSAA